MNSIDRRALWKAALLHARQCLREGDREAAWAMLERAHILSQPYAWPHVLTHLAMLRTALAQRDAAEVWGQILRTIVAAPGSLLRKYPEGNTGRSNVSMFQSMDAPLDLFEMSPASDKEKHS